MEIALKLVVYTVTIHRITKRLAYVPEQKKVEKGSEQFQLAFIILFIG